MSGRTGIANAAVTLRATPSTSPRGSFTSRSRPTEGKYNFGGSTPDNHAGRCDFANVRRKSWRLIPIGRCSNFDVKDDRTFRSYTTVHNLSLNAHGPRYPWFESSDQWELQREQKPAAASEPLSEVLLTFRISSLLPLVHLTVPWLPNIWCVIERLFSRETQQKERNVCCYRMEYWTCRDVRKQTNKQLEYI